MMIDLERPLAHEAEPAPAAGRQVPASLAGGLGPAKSLRLLKTQTRTITGTKRKSRHAYDFFCGSIFNDRATQVVTRPQAPDDKPGLSLPDNRFGPISSSTLRFAPGVLEGQPA
jgi:hypothetical protein